MQLGSGDPSANLCCIEFEIEFSTANETDENCAIIALGEKCTSRAESFIALR